MTRQHNIQSVRYSKPDDTSVNAPVVAIMVDGSEVHRRANDDIGGGGMQAFLAEGGTISAYVAPPKGTDDVNAERDRRVTGGFVWNGNEYQTDEESQKNISGALAFALAASLEDPQGTKGAKWASAGMDFSWTTADNQEVVMTATECLEFCKAAMLYKTTLIKTARALKDLGVLPADLEADQYWPSRNLT